jgi:predicted lipid-binding transport protein (Tim44 family)
LEALHRQSFKSAAFCGIHMLALPFSPARGYCTTPSAQQLLIAYQEENQPDRNAEASTRWSGWSQEMFLTDEILRAYTLCDLIALRPLLSAEVHQACANGCAARTARGETLELTLIGTEAAEITEIEATPEAMEITVRFRTRIVRSERSAAGKVVGGDATAVKGIADLWTFSRPLPLGGEG